MKKGCIDNKGLTLIEIVIAIMLLGYVSLILCVIFMNIAINVNQTKLRTLAYNYASDYMEELKGRDFIDIATGTWHQEEELVEGRKFERQAVITSEDDDLKKINIEVAWTAHNKNKTLEISSYVSSIEE